MRRGDPGAWVWAELAPGSFPGPSPGHCALPLPVMVLGAGSSCPASPKLWCWGLGLRALPLPILLVPRAWVFAPCLSQSMWVGVRP